MKKLTLIWILAAGVFAYFQNTTEALKPVKHQQIAFKEPVVPTQKVDELEELKMKVDSILNKTSELSKVQVIKSN